MYTSIQQALHSNQEAHATCLLLPRLARSHFTRKKEWCCGKSSKQINLFLIVFGKMNHLSRLSECRPGYRAHTSPSSQSGSEVRSSLKGDL